MYDDFFNYDDCRHYLESVVSHYENTAATVSAYADSVYVRLGDGLPVDVSELITLQKLSDGDGFLHPNVAANLVYKLQSRLGQDTTGQAGY